MSEPDDIEKLLREIDAMNAGSGSSSALPAAPQNKAIEPAASASTGSGRMAWTGVSGVGGLVVGGLAGLFLPGMGMVEGGLAAALGALATGFVSGPPDWFRRS